MRCSEVAMEIKGLRGTFRKRCELHRAPGFTISRVISREDVNALNTFNCGKEFAEEEREREKKRTSADSRTSACLIRHD